MTAAELSLVIKAKDQSKKAFTSLKGRVSKSYAQLGKFTKFARERFRALGSGLATFAKRGAIALAAFGVAMGYAFVKALRATIAFEMQMAKVSTMLDKNSRKLLPEFRKAISGMAMEFGEATSSLTDGAYDILSAMVAPKEAMKVLRTGANAAIAGFTDTKTAISALLTAMKAYGIKTSKVTEISDKFLTVQERGRTTLSEMAPVFGRLAAMSASAGGSFDETAAAMATVTRAGLPTVLAITGLSAAYRTFLISSDEAKEAAKRAGFELTQQWLKTHSLREALEMIHNTRQVELKDVFATSEAILAAGLLMKNLGGFTKDTTAVTKDFAGATERAADKIKSQLGFQLKKLKSGFIEVGKAMTRKFGDKLKPIIEAANKIMPRIIELFGKIGDALAKKVGPYMEKFLEYLRTVTKEKLAEQYEKLKEAFKYLARYIRDTAIGMGVLAVMTNLWVIELAGALALLEGIREAWKAISGAWKLGRGGAVEKEAVLARRYAKSLADAGGNEEMIIKSLEKANKLDRKRLKYANEYNKIMSGKFPAFDTMERFFTGEPLFKSAADKMKESFEMFGKTFRDVATEMGTVTSKEISQEEAINVIFENRKKLLDALQKARAKVPTERFRYTTAAGGQEVVTKEHPAGIPIEQFDKTVAEANALNQTLDDLGKATNGMLGDLITGFQDGTVKIDGLVKGIAAYTDKVNTLSNAQTNVLTQVSGMIKSLTSNLNKVIKKVNAVELQNKQLIGQAAG